MEDSYEKTVSDTDTEKEEERIPKEHANESDKSADIRNYFTKQNSDRGVT